MYIKIQQIMCFVIEVTYKYSFLIVVGVALLSCTTTVAIGNNYALKICRDTYADVVQDLLTKLLR